jgi:inosose dehydratase
MKTIAIPHQGRIKWSYGLNQWKTSFQGFSREEQHMRAFKVNVGCGFRAVELTAGTGPWEPLGRPETIRINHGSVSRLLHKLEDCGIAQISSMIYDPSLLSFEELHFGLMPTKQDDHAAILHRCTLYADFLQEVGGDVLAVYPVPSFWREGALNLERREAAAACWTQVGAMAAARGTKLALHVDALSALRTVEDIDALLALLDPTIVGLAIDTAELTIAGHDVVALYRRFHPRVWHFHFKDALATDTLDEYRLHNAERDLIAAGGAREVPRWFGDLGTGLVDFPALLAAMHELGYEGWVIVESDKGPEPVAASMMSNSWFVQHRLLASA